MLNIPSVGFPGTAVVPHVAAIFAELQIALLQGTAHADPDPPLARTHTPLPHSVRADLSLIETKSTTAGDVVHQTLPNT